MRLKKEDNMDRTGGWGDDWGYMDGILPGGGKAVSLTSQSV